MARRKTTLPKVKARHRITNGSHLLPGVDGRSSWARRFRDLIALHTADRGGSASLSEAERVLIRKVACLVLESERLELKFARSNGASAEDLDVYQRMLNSLRRTFETLDRTPFKQSVPRSRRNGHASAYASDIAIIDAELA